MAASIEKRIERLEELRQREASEEQEREKSTNRSIQDFKNKIQRLAEYRLENPSDDPSDESIEEIRKAIEEDPRFGGPRRK